MTRREGVILASRGLAIYLTINALVALSALPEVAYSFQHYAVGTVTTTAAEYWRHHHLIERGFLMTRIIGYSLMASWLFRCGPEIEEWLLPAQMRGESGDHLPS